MANTISKIERLGLGDRVQALYLQGVTTGKAIAEALCKENPGLKLSKAAASRYLQTMKLEAKKTAFQRVTEHVDRVVPEDLDALEEIEKTALKWAKEDAADITSRTAQAAIEIEGEIREWKALISMARSEDLGVTVRTIIQKCLAYLTRDARFQARRMASYNLAQSVIALKLKHAGLLGDEAKGNFIIRDRSGEYVPAGAGQQERKDGHKSVVFSFDDLRQKSSGGGRNG